MEGCLCRYVSLRHPTGSLRRRHRGMKTRLSSGELTAFFLFCLGIDWTWYVSGENVHTSLHIGVLLFGGDLGRGQDVARAAQQYASDVILPSDVTLKVTVVEVGNSAGDWCDRFNGSDLNGLVLWSWADVWPSVARLLDPGVPVVLTGRLPSPTLPALHPHSPLLQPRGRRAAMLDAVLDIARAEQETRLVFLLDSSADRNLRHLLVAAAQDYIEVGVVDATKDLVSCLQDVIKRKNSSQLLVIPASPNLLGNLSVLARTFANDLEDLSWLVLARELTKDLLSSVGHLLPSARFLTEWTGSLERTNFNLNLRAPNRSSDLFRLNDTVLSLSDVLLWDGVTLLAEYMMTAANYSFTGGVTPTGWCKPRNTSLPSPPGNIDITQFVSSHSLLPVTPFDHAGFGTGSVFHLVGVAASQDSFQLTEFGRWSRNDRFRFTANLQSLSGGAFGQLHNRTLIVGLLEAPPFLIKGNDSSWSGFSMDILHELARLLNFSYVLVEPPDKAWGSAVSDGTWNGLVGMAMNKEIDLAIGPLTLTNERQAVVDFTKPYMEDWTGILVRQSEDRASKMFRTFKPFSPGTWVGIGGAILVVGLCLYVANRASPYSITCYDSPDTLARRRSLLDNIWVVFESYMEQGAEVFPSCASGMLMLGLWWIFTIVLAGTYTAGLAASLTVAYHDKPIRSLDDLVAQTAVTPLIKKGSFLASFFKNGESAVYQRIWRMLETAPEVRTNEEALALVQTGRYALLTDFSQVEALRKADCQGLQIGDKFNKVSQGFLAQRDSPLRKMISYNILKLQESGLVEKWRHRWWSASSRCPRDSHVISNVASLELDSTAGPFIVFAVCTALALVCLGLELLLARLPSRTTRQAQPTISTATSMADDQLSEDSPQGAVFRVDTSSTLNSQSSYPSCLGDEGTLY